MTDIIIGVSHGLAWRDLQYWINSINLSGFQGERVIILMDCDRDTLTQIQRAAFTTVALAQDQDGDCVYQSQVPVHVERFIHVADYLRNHGPFRWVVATDVRDVIFQKDPIPWLDAHCQHHDLVFSSEALRYQHEPWGNQNLLDTFGSYAHAILGNNEIFNVGVLAGRNEAMQALCLNIFYHSLNRPAAICDQAVFNFLISQPPYTGTSLYTRSSNAWACQLGTTADPSKIGQFRQHLLDRVPSLQDAQITNGSNEPFCVVHQYDRVPQWSHILQARFS